MTIACTNKVEIVSHTIQNQDDGLNCLVCETEISNRGGIIVREALIEALTMLVAWQTVRELEDRDPMPELEAAIEHAKRALGDVPAMPD